MKKKIIIILCFSLFFLLTVYVQEFGKAVKPTNLLYLKPSASKTRVPESAILSISKTQVSENAILSANKTQVPDSTNRATDKPMQTRCFFDKNITCSFNSKDYFEQSFVYGETDIDISDVGASLYNDKLWPVPSILTGSFDLFACTMPSLYSKDKTSACFNTFDKITDADKRLDSHMNGRCIEFSITDNTTISLGLKYIKGNRDLSLENINIGTILDSIETAVGFRYNF